MECACEIDLDVYDYDCDSKYIDGQEITAIVTHKCTECYEIIQPGSWFFREVFLENDGSVGVWKTCEHCYSLRKVFFSGFYFGMLWENMGEFVHECDGDISVSCIKQLTKVARDKVLDMVEGAYNRYD